MKSWRYLVPNFFTAVSFTLGLASLFLALEENLTLAAWLILWSVLLDKVDGTAARILGATSRFGSELDSMADLLSFGVAPAFLAYATGRQVWGLEPAGAGWIFLTAGGGIYALCAALRLARFNLEGHDRKDRHFTGLASTLCGAIVPSLLLVSFKYEISMGLMRFFPLVLIALGLGMISRLPLPKMLPRKNRLFNSFQMAIIAFTYVAGFAMVLPEYLLGVALFYAVIGTTHGLLRSSGKHRETSGLTTSGQD